METYDENTQHPSTGQEERQGRWNGRALAGVVVIGVGSVLLAERLGFYIPDWLFSWKMLLVAIGLYIGAKHSFKGTKWMVPILIGSVFIIVDITTIDFNTAKLFWPVVIIVVGIMMIVKPRRANRQRWNHWNKDYYANAQTSQEDVLDSVTIFGSVKKNIISKNFKGGESVSVFGGTELNLMQADINGRVVIELVQVFGGTKIVVPSNWQVQDEEMVSIFGGIEDKRPLPSGMIDYDKVLILRGTSIFGGINIKSY